MQDPHVRSFFNLSTLLLIRPTLLLPYLHDQSQASEVEMEPRPEEVLPHLPVSDPSIHMRPSSPTVMSR
jgi:hypothetical protein